MIQGLIAPPLGTLITPSSLGTNLWVAGLPTTGGWWDALQKTTGYTATGGSFGLGQFGPKRIHSATTDRFSGVGIGNNLPTGPCSMLIIFAKRDTTARAAGLIGFQSGADGVGRIGVHAPFSDGNVYWDYGGSTNNTSRLTISGQSWVAGVPSVWIFTTGKRGMEAWRDGKKIGSNSANPTRTRIGNAWCLGTNGNTASDLLDFYGLAVWGRQLEPADIDLLSGNPFAIYQRPRSLAFQNLVVLQTLRRRQLVNG